MAYSDKVIDHYENPRNVGSFDKGDDSVGTGMVGAPAGGDERRLAGGDGGQCPALGAGTAHHGPSGGSECRPRPHPGHDAWARQRADDDGGRTLHRRHPDSTDAVTAQVTTR